MIIGFVGFKQIGKSTASKYLEEKYDFYRHNFKDALVAEMKDNFPDLLQALVEREYPERLLPDETAHADWIDQLFIDKPPLMRALMQNYGTDVRRKDDGNYWVKQWLKNSYGGFGNIVCDDIRFKNEAAALKGRKGIIIRLTRPDVETGGDHASETEQLEIVADYTIECEKGDLESLYNKLDEIYREIKAG